MFRIPVIMSSCALLLVACGNDNPASFQPSLPATQEPGPGPVAAPVTDAIDMQWKEFSAFGGVTGIARHEDAFLVAKRAAISRFDLESGGWERLDARGQTFVATADGHIYTDHGYRLSAGAREWEQLSFAGPVWLGEDGRTLFRKEGNDGVLYSEDNAGTWNELPAAPALFFSLAQFNGDLYAAVSGSGLWRLKQTEQE